MAMTLVEEIENLRNRLAAEGLLRGSDEKVLSVEEAIEEIENLRDRLAAEGLLRGNEFCRLDRDLGVAPYKGTTPSPSFRIGDG